MIYVDWSFSLKHSCWAPLEYVAKVFPIREESFHATSYCWETLGTYVSLCPQTFPNWIGNGNNDLSSFLKCKYSVHVLAIPWDRIFYSLPGCLATEKQPAKMTLKDCWSSRQTSHSAALQLKCLSEAQQASVVCLSVPLQYPTHLRCLWPKYQLYLGKSHLSEADLIWSKRNFFFPWLEAARANVVSLCMDLVFSNASEMDYLSLLLLNI